MIVAWRTWAIRQVQVGVRRVAQRVPVPLLPGPVPDVTGVLAGDLLAAWATQYREEPVTADVLVGVPGTTAEWRWQPGVNVAACADDRLGRSGWGGRGHVPPTDHPEPASPGCGFYAVKAPGLLEPRRATAFGGGAGGCYCSIPGLVGLSGEVTEGPFGYRAAQARVLALLATPTWRQQHHHDPLNCGCGGGRFHVPAVDPAWKHELAGVHLAGLAARYQVPIFADQADLARYAEELTEPPSWPVEAVPPPPGPDLADLVTRDLRAMLRRMTLPPYRPGGLVRSPEQDRGGS